MAGANSTTPRFERPNTSRLEKMFQGLICRPQIAATLLGGLLVTTGCSERPDKISYPISTIAGESIVQIPHDVKVEGCNRMTLEGKEGCEFDRSKDYTLEQGHDVYKGKIESTCLFPDNYFCGKERVKMVFHKQRRGQKENAGIQVKQHEGGGLSLDTLDFRKKCRNQVENIFFRTQAGGLIPVESNTAAELYELNLKGDAKGSYFRCEGVLWVLNAAPKEVGEISYFEPVER